MMGGVCKVSRWDGLRFHDVHTKFHSDWVSHLKFDKGGYADTQHTDDVNLFSLFPNKEIWLIDSMSVHAFPISVGNSLFVVITNIESVWCSVNYGHTKLSARSWAILEKLPVAQLLKNFPTFYRTRRFITVFKRAPPLVPVLSQMTPVHSTPF
jgi:hypothetical protein